MIFNLTKLQKEILLHRLVLADTIAEVFADSDGQDWQGNPVGDYSREMIMDVAEALCNGFAGNCLDTSTAEAVSLPAAKEVMAEALEGSTWIGCMEGNVTEQTIRKHIAAGEALADIIENWVGRKVYFPNW
jgi:hypothetical protein